jgi:hypothetical protein
MTLETVCIIGSILGSVASVSAVLSARRTRPAQGRTVTVIIHDPIAGLTRTVARSTRGIEQIRRDVERAIREGC